MNKFIIGYGLAGGFGGIQNYEVVEAKDLEMANRDAYDRACEEYSSYEGLHGLRTVEEVEEEEGVDYEEALYIWEEEREGWLDYTAMEFSFELARELSAGYHYHDPFN